LGVVTAYTRTRPRRRPQLARWWARVGRVTARHPSLTCWAQRPSTGRPSPGV